MKKILVLVMVAFATSVFAVNTTNYKAIYKLNNETTFNSLVQYLNASDTQVDQLKNMFRLSENKMRVALKSGNVEAADHVLLYNAGNAKYILTYNQYKKYLTVLNLSINNKSADFLIRN
jgi:hypothetical protein